MYKIYGCSKKDNFGFNMQTNFKIFIPWYVMERLDTPFFISVKLICMLNNMVKDSILNHIV